MDQQQLQQVDRSQYIAEQTRALHEFRNSAQTNFSLLEVVQKDAAAKPQCNGVEGIGRKEVSIAVLIRIKRKWLALRLCSAFNKMKISTYYSIVEPHLEGTGNLMQVAQMAKDMVNEQVKR